MLSEKEHRESPAGLECQTTIMSDAPATILRTRVYRGCWTPALDEALTRCRHAQRALYKPRCDGNRAAAVTIRAISLSV